jgi:hypothetical protein
MGVLDNSLLNIYFIIVFLTMIFAFVKVGINKTSLFIILVFWEGLFQYLGFITNSDFHNYYKIAIVLYLLALIFQKDYISISLNKKNKNIIIAYLIFVIIFWISYFLRGGKIITIFSQFFYKFSFVFLAFLYFYAYIKDQSRLNYFKKVLLTVISLQIFLSIVKILIFGLGVEPVVGSMSARGAGNAVVIPISALIFYWLIKNGHFSYKDWIYSLLIFIIAIASGKRQPVIFYPIFLFLLFYYLKSTKFKFVNFFIYVPLVLILFYLGVRLVPSLTPENKVWGSFDMKYVTSYSMKYYFGTDNLNYLLSGNYDYSFGRGSGFIYYFHPDKLKLDTPDKIMFGNGLYEVASMQKGRFTATGMSDYGIEHQGLIGEAAAILYSLGYLGIISLFCLSYFILKSCNNKKLFFILFIYYLWDALFYYNQFVFGAQSAILILFIVFYSKYEYNNDKVKV